MPKITKTKKEIDLNNDEGFSSVHIPISTVISMKYLLASKCEKFGNVKLAAGTSRITANANKKVNTANAAHMSLSFFTIAFNVNFKVYSVEIKYKSIKTPTFLENNKKISNLKQKIR